MTHKIQLRKEVCAAWRICASCGRPAKWVTYRWNGNGIHYGETYRCADHPDRREQTDDVQRKPASTPSVALSSQPTES